VSAVLQRPPLSVLPRTGEGENACWHVAAERNSHREWPWHPLDHDRRVGDIGHRSVVEPWRRFGEPSVHTHDVAASGRGRDVLDWIGYNEGHLPGGLSHQV
jgi:hypothetical protein